MRLLCELSDKMLGIGEAESFEKPYKLRKAARAVILNEKGKIAYQFLTRPNLHKLPGGGVDTGETIEEALHREVREEVGYAIENITSIGMTIEYRNQFDLIQISYAFLARAGENFGEPEFTEEEIADGHTSLWVPIDEAISLLEADTPTEYESHFI